MPKRTDITSILIVGAGPIVIGQACEFDYSGTQACKVLKEDGYRVLLVNSNPATIMTDPTTADRIFIEPITPECVEKIIAQERPDAILPTVGGQTALNCSLELSRRGVLDRYNVKMLGATPDAIDKAENRKRFNEAMTAIGLEVPRNVVVNTLEEAMSHLETIGLPAIIRPSFTLGGSGSGIARTEEEYIAIVKNGLALSPITEVLIDESILGWKEYEMEVIRDKNDNAIIVCSIENVDPMGVHTGDSITVAPALTLTDKEYQLMRDASIAVLREIGVETGGSNVQFAVHPQTGRLVVIEMNPRVSRSSALASKATGYPIAKIAARLAVGYTLDEISNDITQVTPASFEPTIDYVVVKMPRFTFEKFPKTSPVLSSQMKSVGEAMAIGRSFAESLQKGLRSMETGLTGLNEVYVEGVSDELSLAENQRLIKKDLARLSPDRLLRVAQAMRYGITDDDLHDITSFDPWFLNQIRNIVDMELKLKKEGAIRDKARLLSYKSMGFSDSRLAQLIGMDEVEFRKMRQELGVRPVYKKVDTCAGEFESGSSYIYSSYEKCAVQDPECEAQPENKKKVVILGGGPNRIGQGIEFDYACVHAAFSLSEEGVQTIMVNCNPETVSTDYDTSDRLYFEPLTQEDVIELIQNEQKLGDLLGVVVQFGGQTPLKLSRSLEEAGIPIIGTAPDKIDLAEDRDRFKKLLDELDLIQPKNDVCFRVEDIAETIEKVGYPVVVRPSNVLGGRAMAIIHNETDLQDYLTHQGAYISTGAILVDKFLQNAIEIDVDALSDSQDVFVAGVMEHIEEAGIHSGDSACSLPPFSLSQWQLDQVRLSTVKLSRALNVIGLMNVQYAFQGDQLYVIEVNPRASRTAPFVAKATGNSIAKIAAKLMIGKPLKEISLLHPVPRHVSIKEVIFPFGRFDNVDVCLGPEMKSTGEGMGIDKTFGVAYYKAQESVGNMIPLSGSIAISVRDQDKEAVLDAVKQFDALGFTLYATHNTAAFLKRNGIMVERVSKIQESAKNIVTMIKEKKFDLVLNIPAREDVARSLKLRRATVMSRVSYVTTARGFSSMAKAVMAMREQGDDFSVTAIQDWIAQMDTKGVLCSEL